LRECESDVERAERDDERRQLDVRDQCAVQQAERDASQKAAQNREIRIDPESTANFVITIEPSAMTIPHDRSIPAVRMTSVWPIAITPTTMTCCRISEKFWPVRKRSVCDAKKMQAASSASSGP
jgi:hypothetical protein